MSYITIALENRDILDDVKETFHEYELDILDINLLNPKDESVTITFYGEEDEIAELYADLCKKHPKVEIPMSIDNDEGFITYYDNEDGWGHRDYIEEYDTDEE